MFKRHYQKRSTNIFFVIFRLILSLVMFIALLSGIYSAYKHFSGLDPLKLDPQTVFKNLTTARTPKQFMDVLSSLKIDPKVMGKAIKPDTKPANDQAVLEKTTKESSNSNPVFRFLLIADSHSDSASLSKALDQAKQAYPDLKFIIGLGDYTDVGTTSELTDAKKEFDKAALRYFLIPGDHDLWDCRNRNLVPTDCFKSVFGPNYQSFIFDDFQFLLLDNSNNYEGFSSEQLKWITDELEKGKKDEIKGIFVFLHEPLHHPSSDHVMGRVEKNLKSQAGGLMFQLKEARVKKVFAGDTHLFSEYLEPTTSISMVTVGSLSLERNPQPPRFAVVTVFDDGSTKVEDVEIK